MKLCPALILLCPLAAAGTTASQTDWSGGPGVHGPVSSWGDAFWTVSQTDWVAFPGSVVLQIGTEHTVCKSSGTDLATGDFDGDGCQDLAIVSSGNVLWAGYLPGSVAWTLHPVVASGGVTSVVTGDIDGDGDCDIAGALMYSSEVRWWENNGSGGGWAQHQVLPGCSGMEDLHCADVDMDGHLDLVSCTYSPSALAWWENSGAGLLWTRHDISISLGGPRAVWAADVDGDGWTDLLAAGSGYYNRRAAWFCNLDGAGTAWGEITIDPFFDGGCFVSAGDLDGDGDVDVAGAADQSDEVCWWENLDGIGGYWMEHSLDNGFGSAKCALLVDLDCDGDQDILAVAMEDHDVGWWENISGPEDGLAFHLLTDSLHYTLAAAALDAVAGGPLEVASCGTQEVRFWNLAEYPPTGTLESTILDTDCAADWTSVDWSAATPLGTSAGLQVRSSYSPWQWGEWSDTLWTPGPLQGVLADDTRYLQYRVVLMSGYVGSTPAMQEITFTWNTMSSGSPDPPPGIELLPAGANPFAGPVSISLGVPSPGFLTISVIDIAGRLVGTAPGTEYAPGWHTVGLGELPPGVYFVRLTGDFQAAMRIVTVE